MNFNNFENEGIWFKGNLHCHTTVSDGTYTPEEIKDIYKRNGYSFVAFTDHDVFTDLDHLNDEEFLVYPGMEIKSLLSSSPDKCGDFRGYHLLCLSGPNDEENGNKFEKGEIMRPLLNDLDTYHSNTQELVNTLINRGVMVTVNHPIWSRLLPEDLLNIDHYFALEIYNSQCAVDGDDTGTGVVYWDLLLRKGMKVWGFAADDNHNKDVINIPGGKKILEDHERWASCKGWVCVKAKDLTKNSIAMALKEGRFYSSTGPEILEYQIIDNCVNVKCSKVKRIDFITYDRRGWSSFNYEEGLTAAEYRLFGDERYVRVECTDFNGNKAWTNPIFL
ncbi:CehA/McbA family metallohydrolase domain-containing protein [Vallitalea okinawensis]|uniref:hypothetical protein n=1 Tax=Vallitalea okinawensis TaxID=2078660 RepID=UPI000CFCEDD5|nr:hypothetical protein [Vallitalea okinawensis]